MNKEDTKPYQDKEMQVFKNLSHGLGKRGLVSVALNAVQNLDWNTPELVNKSTRTFQPRMMVTLLGYCYACGLYGSREIHRAIQTDPMVRYICAREYPDVDFIQRFRKENRTLILQCLHYILTQCWALKMDEAEVEFISYEWFETVLSAKINRETHDRIEIASFIDLMENDF